MNKKEVKCSYGVFNKLTLLMMVLHFLYF